MTTRPPFPIAWDSTMVKAFRTCPKMFYWEYMLHYKTKASSVHLHAGKAFASGLEAMRKAFWHEGLSSEDALLKGIGVLLTEYGDFECPSDSPKSADRMAGALEYYHATYPLGGDGADPVPLSDGTRAIEFSFAIPLHGSLRHPETEEPIIYTGRADQVVSWAGGIYPEDDKTTGQLGAKWADNWLMRSQFTGYVWAARQLWEKVQGALVTGIAIRKTGFDHARVPTARAPFMVDRWHSQTIEDIMRAMTMWETGYWDYNLDESCNNYGKCPMLDPCMSINPQPWLDTHYEIRRWDPISRSEEALKLLERPKEDDMLLSGAFEGLGFRI